MLTNYALIDYTHFVKNIVIKMHYIDVKYSFVVPMP